VEITEATNAENINISVWFNRHKYKILKDNLPYGFYRKRDRILETYRRAELQHCQ
jgi:hypothetical protein